MKILSVLVLIVLSTEFLYAFGSGFIEGMRSASNHALDLNDLSELELTPTPTSSTGIPVVNEQTGEKVRIWPTHCYVQKGERLEEECVAKHTFAFFMTFIAGIASTVAIIAFLSYLVKFLSRIAKGTVFEARNFKCLRNAGIYGLVGSLLIFVFSVGMTYTEADGVTFSGYSVNYLSGLEECSEMLIESLFLLLFSEVFLVGMKQKEELDLTV